MEMFDKIIGMAKEADFIEKKQLLEYILDVIERAPNQIDEYDLDALKEYSEYEIENLISALKVAKSYREKSLLMACEDCVLEITMRVYGSFEQVPDEVKNSIKVLTEAVDEERYLENTADKIFGQEKIEEAYIERLISFASHCDDEYQRGMLYVGLENHKDRISDITDGAKAAIGSYIVSELKRYLSFEKWSDDCVDTLELVADVAKYFADDEMVSLICDVMKRAYSNINYYAAETLLYLGKDVPQETVSALADDLEYADLTYDVLKKYGKTCLFPAELRDPVYLAKSNLVHWLVYPTELGEKPYDIEYIGKIKYLFKKDEYYVFKYRSGSENLNDEIKGQWLIGWSSEDGGTFSNFDLLSEYDKGDTEKTLRNIKKKLIG